MKKKQKVWRAKIYSYMQELKDLGAQNTHQRLKIEVLEEKLAIYEG